MCFHVVPVHDSVDCLYVSFDGICETRALLFICVQQFVCVLSKNRMLLLSYGASENYLCSCMIGLLAVTHEDNPVALFYTHASNSYSSYSRVCVL